MCEEPAQRPVRRFYDAVCEVTDRECIWARAYERLKAYEEETSMLEGPVVFNDNALRGTSAWANTFGTGSPSPFRGEDRRT